MGSLEQLIVETARSVRPPERLSVSQAAVKYRRLNNPGSYVGPWRNDMAPYLVEVQDVLNSPDHTGAVFVGPAQCGKTDIFLNWVTWTLLCDPADMMLVQTSQSTARDFSIRRMDRLHRHNPFIKEQMVQCRDADNTYDKKYKSGALISLVWPTVNELSGKPVPRLWLTDYDRMPVDVGGEGSPFDLARKRATTFGSHGMCMVESSPGFVVENPKWIARTKHEAPPTKGILSLYNRGDRRRWYWRCVSCHYGFEPDFSLLSWPDSEDFMESAEAAVLLCPHCQAKYPHEPCTGSLPGKYGMNLSGVWLKDGQILDVNGAVTLEGVRSDIASFWLKGTSAAFADWKTLVFNYLTARSEYHATGSEDALKTTTNTDQGSPYVPVVLSLGRAAEDLKNRAKPIGFREVPAGVRFLVASIDVQRSRFVVQVHGTGPGKDVWVIDRFDIKKSKRLDEDGDPGRVRPGSAPEDWKLLTEAVILKSYPLGDGSGRHMGIRLTVCDSAGEAGVTANAYDFVRWLRRGVSAQGDGYGWSPDAASRFLLLKGASSKTAPRVSVGFPDSSRKDRHARARGEIPVVLMNTNMLKDMLNAMLDRREPCGGRITFPDWLDDRFFSELTAEVRDPQKGWRNPKKYRNESWDLLTYYLAATLTQSIGIDYLDWDSPPGWAREWDRNDLVFDPEKRAHSLAGRCEEKVDFGRLGELLA